MKNLIVKSSFAVIGKNYNMGMKEYDTFQGEGIPLEDILLYRSIDNNILSGRTPSKNNPDYWNDGEHEFFTMKDADLDLYILNEECTDKLTDVALQENKNLLQVPAGTLLVSNAMTIGLALIAQRSVYINQNVFALYIDQTRYSKVFLKWYFNYVLRPKFQKQYESKYLSKNELGKILLPRIPLEQQKSIEKKIAEIEDQITLLKDKFDDDNKAITKIFARELAIDFSEIDLLKKEKLVFKSTKFVDLSSSNYDMRLGFKFQSPIKTKLEELLASISTIKLKSLVESPIVLGESISQNDYADENIEEYRYVSMASIKNWTVDIENSKFIQTDYFNMSDKTVMPDDIIMARSGEGTIGKVALVPKNIRGIFADFTMRIRIFNEYSAKFIYYYLRSDFIQLLVESYKKGLGNNTNIFPNEINDFPVPYLDIDRQAEIIQLIDDELCKSKEKLEAINELTSQIRRIIIEF
ncbi:restriction endonuclease subunit S [Paenibacillus sp. FSL H7-0350]|uniref:restriction endonuclease subunit S n=1 Tax=Paenibacillus sp. FSL H7-0350 TaxID=2975345 RepID=UPI0031591CF6